MWYHKALMNICAPTAEAAMLRGQHVAPHTGKDYHAEGSPLLSKISLRTW